MDVDTTRQQQLLLPDLPNVFTYAYSMCLCGMASMGYKFISCTPARAISGLQAPRPQAHGPQAQFIALAGV